MFSQQALGILDRFREKLLSSLEECSIRFKSNPTADLVSFGASVDAAVGAGVLGFAIPPIENVRIARPQVHELLSQYPEFAEVHTFRVNDPFAFTYSEFATSAAALRSGSEPDPPVIRLKLPNRAVIDRMSESMEAWQRIVAKLNLSTIIYEMPHRQFARSVQQQLCVDALLRARRVGVDSLTIERESLSETDPDVAAAIEQWRQRNDKFRLAASVYSETFTLARKEPRKPPPRKRAPRTKLTPEQKKIADTVDECGGSMVKAAQRLEKKPSLIRKEMVKINRKRKLIEEKPRSVGAKNLPTDRRGNVIVESQDE